MKIDKTLSFLKGINWLTIFLLLILIIIPHIYLEILSEETFSISRILSSVLYSLPLCILVACIGKKSIYVALSFIIMMVSFFETVMVVLYKNYIIAGNIIAALTTTSDESTGFIMSSLHALPWTLPIIAAFGLLLWLYQKPKRVMHNLLCAGIFAILSVGFLAYQLKVRWGGADHNEILC